MTRPTPPDRAGRTLAFVSLGCPKNLVDSERMLGKLAQDGYALTPDADGADVVVVNTCGFIEPARQESLGVIREMLDLKRQGRVGAVVVAGCLAERKKDDLLTEVPEVDHIVGVFGREEITQVLDRTLRHRRRDEQRSLFRPAPVRAFEDTARLRITPRHYAYLKISEGCDRLCTFCAIPAMRGKHVTKPIEEVAREAKELAADGVRELIVVAQDTTYYGLDLYGRVRLAELLRELEKVGGLEWIRILYAYPIHFTDELIDTLAQSKKIVPYLDMPLQHVNDRMLKRMQRRVDRGGTEDLLRRLRGAIPGLALRTTFIVGFPGETEAEFEELLDFVRATRFERVGVFPYSPEPDTPATRLDGHLSEDIKKERRDQLMEAQQEVAFAWSRRQLGKEL
ncbi:MAG TPA: 30S ribosomal protein S12 methylthiotransferase RimO, partial [Gemmataceae bacterium]|nr:30S ribosomal protein S12 methylthiotransferase RimO [Gemmataceae bacterium]